MNFLYIKQITNFEELIPTTKGKLPYFLEKCFYKLKKLFCIFTLKENILILPIENADKISTLKWNFINKKTDKVISKYNIRNIALSRFLNDSQQFHLSNIQALNGRFIFPYLSFEILEYITNKTRTKLDQLEIAILANHNTELINYILLTLAQKVKLLTVVTNEPEVFNKISQALYEDFGIIVRVSNNKRKCLQKANIVLNYHFDEATLNEYALNNHSIIINFNNKIQILSKSFTGININFFKILTEKTFAENLASCFSKEILLESICLKNTNFQEFINIFHQYNVNISALIGNNGIINEKEFVTIFSQNRLDKNIYLP